MSDRTYAKVQAQHKTSIGSSSKHSLLQRTCACGQHTIASAECSTCRSEQSTLLRSQRAFGPPSAPGTVPGNAPALENVPSFNSAFDRTSRFGHDFSRIPIHPPAAGVIQTKLAINKPGDEYEQEADRVADQVMTMPAHHSVSGAPAPIQRFAGQPTGPGEATPASVDQALASPGRPLEPTLQQDMEQRFGHDFSRVRVHSGAAAEQSAQDVNATAYTVGHDMVFGTGRFAPGAHEGRRLIAHELTHVVQQSSPGDNSGRVVMRQPKPRQAPPMPVAPPAQQPSAYPTILTSVERDSFEKASIAAVGLAFTAFTNACTAQVAAFKAEDKAKAEIMAVTLDIFFGLAAPIFAQHLLAGGRAKAVEKLADWLSKKSDDKTVKAISESDFLKEGFKAVGKIGTSAIKINPTALFGEEDVQLFGRQLRDQFQAGAHALTGHISDHKLTDQELIATRLAYDVEFTTETAYVEALKKTFQEFRTYVRPIGIKEFVRPIGQGAGGTYNIRGVWIDVGGKKQLGVINDVKQGGMVGALFGGTEREFVSWVPDHLQSFVIAKTLREFGNVETVPLPEDAQIANLQKIEREGIKEQNERYFVEPLPKATLDLAKSNEDYRAKIEAEIIRQLRLPMSAKNARAMARSHRLLELFRQLASYWSETYRERIAVRRSGDELVNLLFSQISRDTRARIFKVLGVEPRLWK